MKAGFFPESDTTVRKAVIDTYELIQHKIVKSQWLHQLIKKGGADSKIIHLGLDFGVFCRREQLGIFAAEQYLTITAMARPETPRREFKTLIKALSLIQSKFPTTKNILFGDDLSKYKLDLHHEDAGVVPGHNAMSELYSHADVFIEPSDFQAFDRTSMEAMACSILTNVGGISEYAEHAINCLLVSPNKPQPIFEAFERIQNSEKLKLELQQGALKTALEFSHKHEANETLCYFEEIVMIGKWCKY